jgi:CheY-like chemotaxis protein
MAPAILIIDDSSDDAELLRLTLLKSTLVNPVRVVHSALEAIAYIKGTGEYGDRGLHPEPGVAIVDLRMPGMDGIEFLEWLKAYSPARNLLSFVISGGTDFMALRRAYKAGACSFISKPFTVQDLDVLVAGFPGPWEVGAETRGQLKVKNEGRPERLKAKG